MAGHSHWAKIKRAKGANDAKRGKVWSKIARKIIIAAKNGGDPRDNLNLRYTIDEAKAVNMPKGTIENTIKTDAVDEEKLMELVLEAGAEDVKNEGEVYEVFTSPTSYLKVKEAVETAKIAIEASEITNMPTNTVAVDAETGTKLLKLVDALEDNDDVQNVSHNAEIPESVVV